MCKEQKLPKEQQRRSSCAADASSTPERSLKEICRTGRFSKKQAYNRPFLSHMHVLIPYIKTSESL
jgi:hypothetical protein